MKELELICPFCGSDNVSGAQPSARAFAISVLLFGFPLLFTTKTHHCFECGKDFKRKNRENDLQDSKVD